MTAPTLLALQAVADALEDLIHELVRRPHPNRALLLRLLALRDFAASMA